MTKERKILIIDNGSRYVDDIVEKVREESKKIKQEQGISSKITKIRVEKFKTDVYDKNDSNHVKKFDRIIPSGSPNSRDYDTDVHRFIGDNARDDAYVLTVCHAHQQLAKAYGAKLTNSGKMHKGYKEIKVVDKDNELFKGVAEKGKIKAFGHHQFYIKSGEQGDNIKILAESISKTGDTIVEAFQVKDENIFGVQFHPEKQHEKKTSNVNKIFYNVLKGEYAKAA